MSNLMRLTVGSMMFFMVLVLGFFIDAVGQPLIGILDEHGVRDGPFSAVLDAVEVIPMTLVVPALLLGIALWMIWGTATKERREDQVRIQ